MSFYRTTTTPTDTIVVLPSEVKTYCLRYLHNLASITLPVSEGKKRPPRYIQAPYSSGESGSAYIRYRVNKSRYFHLFVDGYAERDHVAMLQAACSTMVTTAKTAATI